MSPGLTRNPQCSGSWGPEASQSGLCLAWALPSSPLPRQVTDSCQPQPCRAPESSQCCAAGTLEGAPT